MVKPRPIPSGSRPAPPAVLPALLLPALFFGFATCACPRPGTPWEASAPPRDARAVDFLLRLGPLPAGRARLVLSEEESGAPLLSLEVEPVAPVSFFVDRSLRMTSRFDREDHRTLNALSVDRVEDRVRTILTLPAGVDAPTGEPPPQRVARLPLPEARDPLAWTALLLARGPEALRERSPAPVAAFGKLRWIELVRSERVSEGYLVEILLKRQPTERGGRRIRILTAGGFGARAVPDALRRIEIQTSLGAVTAEPRSGHR